MAHSCSLCGLQLLFMWPTAALYVARARTAAGRLTVLGAIAAAATMLGPPRSLRQSLALGGTLVILLTMSPPINLWDGPIICGADVHGAANVQACWGGHLHTVRYLLDSLGAATECR